jgi:acetolactate synthase I/II/III large subunit
MSLTGGQALVAQLKREGVEHVFGIPGVQLDWAVEALRQSRREISYIVPRHEQTASYMADGYARTTTKREGVSMVVPGPGMLNALTGLATAYACSSRVLFIAGQIPTSALGRGGGMLHEIPDQSGILKSLSKWHAIAKSVDQIPGLVSSAFQELRSGHPRPVTLEIPADLLKASTDAPLHDRAVGSAPVPGEHSLLEAASLLREAKFPVIQVGGGAAASDAGAALRELATRLQAPVIMTEGARGILPSGHPLALTSLGGRAVFPHADLVLVVGSRFLDGDGRATWSKANCRYIYVNLDSRHLSTPRTAGIQLQADARKTLEGLLTIVGNVGERPSRAETVSKVKLWCETQLKSLGPQMSYLNALRQSLPDDGILVSELTQVGYVANLAFPAEEPRTFVTPGYQGSLGYGLPTALGAAAGNPHRRVISISGDGGIGWGMQELATAKRYHLNINIIVFVDGHYGNVARIQRQLFSENFAAEVCNPDFALLAAAFGIPFVRVESPESLAQALSSTSAVGGPHFIEVRVGEMPSPWALIHPFLPSSIQPPPNPLGEPVRQ